eukprot:4987794-Prymnesium_polylepis.1
MSGGGAMHPQGAALAGRLHEDKVEADVGRLLRHPQNLRCHVGGLQLLDVLVHLRRGRLVALEAHL